MPSAKHSRPSLINFDGLSEVLLEITEVLANGLTFEPEGVVKMYTLEVTDVETVLTSATYPTMPWIDVTFFNDGPDPVFPTLNHDTAQMTTPLKKGDQLSEDFTRPLLEKLILVCDAGKTASIRLKAMK